MEDLTFRKANIDDIDKIVPLMYSAAEELFEYSYSISGKSVKDFLRYVLLSGKGYYGFQNQTVGIYNNEVVISVTTYKGKEVLKETINIFILIFKFYGLMGCLPVFWRSIILSKIFVPPKSDSIYIANLGTKPEYRGKGIATQCLNYIHKISKSAGYYRCEIDVSFKNPRAEKLYTSLGYVITKALQYNGKKNIAGMKRMEKTL